MKLFYEKVQTLSTQLTWSHYSLVVSFNKDKMNYYINISIEKQLTVRELKTRIRNKEYKRLDKDIRQKLASKEKFAIKDFIKNPIVINNKNNYGEVKEKILQKLILEDIENFMLELGKTFCFVGSQYKIKIGDRYNYIDLLLYNIEFNCYVVIELKVVPLRKEHIGQIEIYMNYIDNNLKTINQDKTIGIIISKKDNKFIMEYCSDKRIISREYILL